MWIDCREPSRATAENATGRECHPGPPYESQKGDRGSLNSDGPHGD